jgi:hypothetical protein
LSLSMTPWRHTYLFKLHLFLNPIYLIPKSLAMLDVLFLLLGLNSLPLCCSLNLIVHEFRVLIHYEQSLLCFLCHLCSLMSSKHPIYKHECET